jgi:hypothetical protein
MSCQLCCVLLRCIFLMEWHKYFLRISKGFVLGAIRWKKMVDSRSGHLQKIEKYMWTLNVTIFDKNFVKWIKVTKRQTLKSAIESTKTNQHDTWMLVKISNNNTSKHENFSVVWETRATEKFILEKILFVNHFSYFFLCTHVVYR